MGGEQELGALIKTISAKLVDGVFVFVTVAHDAVPQNISPLMIFKETEGTTLILLETQARVAGLSYEFPCRMITLNVHSSLEAVGFIAYVATALAKQGMGVNPVSGFFHDHLFVPNGREQDALSILDQIAQGAL
jgi:hypothetical protein